MVWPYRHLEISALSRSFHFWWIVMTFLVNEEDLEVAFQSAFQFSCGYHSQERADRLWSWSKLQSTATTNLLKISAIFVGQSKDYYLFCWKILGHAGRHLSFSSILNSLWKIKFWLLELHFIFLWHNLFDLVAMTLNCSAGLHVSYIVKLF